MRPDQQNPRPVTLEGSRSFAFSFLLLDPTTGTSNHTLTIVQHQPSKDAALKAATRLAEASLPGYAVTDWICCELKAAPTPTIQKEAAPTKEGGSQPAQQKGGEKA